VYTRKTGPPSGASSPLAANVQPFHAFRRNTGKPILFFQYGEHTFLPSLQQGIILKKSNSFNMLPDQIPKNPSPLTDLGYICPIQRPGSSIGKNIFIPFKN